MTTPALFQSVSPSAFLWVAAGAAAAGADGSAAKPFPTIGQATSKATPGTAVMVRGGRYAEAVKLPSRGGGTDTAPTWLVSADGYSAAVIDTPAGGQAGIEGLGVQNWSVTGFEVIGGALAGIQFGQSGSDFAHMVRRVRVQGCYVHGGAQDGIKVSQADDVEIVDNRVAGCGQQCIDFVNVWNSLIARNDVSAPGVSAAIFAKAASQDITIVGNHVHDVVGRTIAGILAGGWSSAGYTRPGSSPYEALRVSVTGNLVERVAGPSLYAIAAADTVFDANVIDPTPAGVPGKDVSWSALSVDPSQDKKTLSTRVSFTRTRLLRPLGPQRALLLWDKQTQDPHRDAISADTAVVASAPPPAGPAAFALWSGPGAIETRWAA